MSSGIRPNSIAGAARRRPAAGGFWATIPTFGQEVRTVAIIFAIAGLVMLVARS